jgi:sodium transport system permease protein
LYHASPTSHPGGGSHGDGGSGAYGAGGSTVEPVVAMAIVAAAMATYLLVPALVPSSLVLPVAQAALALVPIAAVLALHHSRPLAALGLRRARLRYVAAAVAIGATTWYVNIRLVALLPLPHEQARRLAELVEEPPLLGSLALFALLPSVCEELLFRGLLARSLARSLRLGVAAAASAALFAAYHLSIVQAIPTLTLGLLFGLVAIRANSALPTMVAHAINNALAIAMTRGELPAVAAWFGEHPTLALAGCAATTGAATWMVVRGPVTS